MSNRLFECPRCYKRCGNAGALKTHMKTHKKTEPKSGSMLKWVVKRVKPEKKPKPKMAIELKPIVKTRQLRLRKPIVRDPTVVPNPVRPRPPRRPRRSKQPPIDTNPFVAPARLNDPGLDKKSPQFRVAHIQHFKSLKSDFPMLDKTMYHKVNKSCLGVSLRRFQEWFQQYDADVDKVENPAPKAKKERHQNKVLCQGARTRFTPKQKMELIQQFDEAVAEDGSLTIIKWCEARKNVNHKTFAKWLKPIARKEIELDAKNPRLKNSRWSSNGNPPSFILTFKSCIF